MHDKMNAGALSGTGAFSSNHLTLSNPRIWYRFDEALCSILNVLIKIRFRPYFRYSCKVHNSYVLWEHL